MVNENEYIYPVARMLATFQGESYARYIDESIREHVAKGHYTEEYAQQMTTAHLYAGNDGE